MTTPNHPAAANPAMSVLSHAGSQWRRVAEVRRSAICERDEPNWSPVRTIW